MLNQSQSRIASEAPTTATQTEPERPTLTVAYEAPKSQSFPIHKVYKIFQDYFRPRRKRAFMRLFPEVAAGAPVLDIGGTAGWWREDFPKNINISIVNIDDDHRQEVTESGFTFFSNRWQEPAVCRSAVFSRFFKFRHRACGRFAGSEKIRP